MPTVVETLRAPGRLALLRATGLLDAEPDAALQRLTRVVARALKVPTAQLSLVDDSRQFICAQTGLTGQLAVERQAPLSHSFCKHVVHGRVPLVVCDAREHPLVSDSLAVCEHGVVAYLGVPIVVEGHVLGSLCAVAAEPRDWTEDDLALMVDLGQAASEAVSLRARRADDLVIEALEGMLGSHAPVGLPFRRAGARGAEVGVWNPRDSVLDSLDAHVAVLDEHGVILVANASWERFAADNGGGPAVGGDYLGTCDAAPDDLTAGAAAHGIRAVLSGERERFELEYPCHAPGEERWFLLRAVRHHAPGPVRVVVQHIDITARRHTEEEARVRANLLDVVDVAVIATDRSGHVTHWNGGAERLLGWTAAEAVGHPITALTVESADLDEAAAIRSSVRKTGRWEGRLDAVRKDGSSFPALVRNVAIKDLDGQHAGVVGFSVDLNASLEAERHLRSARDFSRAVTHSMAEGVCALDADGLLVYMNPAAESMLGWTLQEVAGQSLHELIHSHPPDDTIASAEDCPILRTRRSREVARITEDSFLRRDGTSFPVSYTAAPFDTSDGFRGSVYVVSDITERKADRERLEQRLESLSWIPKIRDALDEERFILHAEPIVDLATDQTVQHELLVRMNDGHGGLVPPGLFLPVAEEHGLIADIDRWVIRQAAELAGRGHAIELNISAKSLAQTGLLEVVETELRRTAADPGLVVFELTETAMLRSDEAAHAFIDGIRALGCGLALDDFGTGYGGFTYLKRFPVDYLKIDIEFVRDLPRNHASRHVVHAVVNLAKGFGQKTIAEGVEDAETLTLLRELGVDYAQGYFLGRPAPLAETIEARS